MAYGVCVQSNLTLALRQLALFTLNPCSQRCCQNLPLVAQSPMSAWKLCPFAQSLCFYFYDYFLVRGRRQVVLGFELKHSTT
jgi:hypothetical protein